MKSKPYVIGSNIAALVAAQLGLEVFAGSYDPGRYTLSGEEIVYWAKPPPCGPARTGAWKLYRSGNEKSAHSYYYNPDSRTAYQFWAAGVPEVSGATPLSAEFLGAHTELSRSSARGYLVCSNLAGTLKTEYSGLVSPLTTYIGDGVLLLQDLLRNAALYRRWQVRSIDAPGKRMHLTGDKYAGGVLYSALAISRPLDEIVRLVYGNDHKWPRFADGCQIANVGGFQKDPWISPGTTSLVITNDSEVDYIGIYSAVPGRWTPTWDRKRRVSMAVHRRVPFGAEALGGYANLASKRLSDWKLIETPEVKHYHWNPHYFQRPEVESERLEVLAELRDASIYPIGAVAQGLDYNLAEDVLDAISVGGAIGI